MTAVFEEEVGKTAKELDGTDDGHGDNLSVGFIGEATVRFGLEISASENVSR